MADGRCRITRRAVAAAERKNRTHCSLSGSGARRLARNRLDDVLELDARAPLDQDDVVELARLDHPHVQLETGGRADSISERASLTRLVFRLE